MSVVRPVRSLLSRGLAATCTKPGVVAVVAAPTIAPLRCHAPFHSSASLEKRKPRFKSVRAEEMGLVTPEKVEEFTKQAFPEYTPEELEILRTRYTPEQMAALEAGEASIDPKDLTIQGRIREDPYRSLYFDDFSRFLRVVDKRPKPHAIPPDNIRFMTEEEDALEVEKALTDMISAGRESAKSGSAEKPGEEEKLNPAAELVATKFLEDPKTLVPEQPSNSALALDIGKQVPGVAGLYSEPIDPADDGLDNDGLLQKVKRKTGLSLRAITKIKRDYNKILVRRRVANQTRLGKIRSASVLAIAGNGNGSIGFGEASAVEADIAEQKALDMAIANMRPIRRYEDRTIYGSVTAKVGATIVKLDSRPPGKFFFFTSLFSLVTPRSRKLTFSFPRIWSSCLSPPLRDLPRSGYPGYRRQDAPRPQPTELCQGVHPGVAQPARSRRDRHRTWQEAGRCKKGVLRPRSIIRIKERKKGRRRPSFY
jgi:small subunit ribosomal protein S5